MPFHFSSLFEPENFQLKTDFPKAMITGSSMNLTIAMGLWIGEKNLQFYLSTKTKTASCKGLPKTISKSPTLLMKNW